MGEILDDLMYSEPAQGIKDTSLAGNSCFESQGHMGYTVDLDGSESEGQYRDDPSFAKL